MPSVLIPDLKRKFGLLRTYSKRQRWPVLAAEFGKSPKTLQGWTQSTSGRDPGFIPDNALPVLIRLVAEILPESCSTDDVRHYVFGPAARLEEELRAGASASLAALLADEAREGTATLIRRPRDIGLVELRDEVATSTMPRVSPGEWFRIEFPLRHPGRYVVALQNAQRVWAVLPTALIADRSAIVRVPGDLASGEPRFMRERRDLGLHRFVCLTAPDPFPAFIEAHGREGLTLDKRGIDELAGFFRSVPRPRRRCQMLVLAVEAAAAP